MIPLSLPGRLATWAFVGLVTLICALPLYWLILSSIKPVELLAQVSLIPQQVTLQNYAEAFASPVPRWLFNTVLIAVLTTALGLAVATLAAFGFARYRFRGKTVLFALVIASLAIPEYASVLPTFAIMRELGLLNTYAAVVLPMAANALVLFLLRQYFTQLPAELFDAARIDGASEIRVFWSVALPLVRPGLGAAGLILFLSSWNAYLLPLVMMSRTEEFTIPVGLAFLHSQLNTGYMEISPWGAVTAGTVLSIMPLIICLMLMQRHFVAGLTAGAVKS
ncbi:sn-glycerol 3-phosphate transport system permease protein [Devosia enhydra]|uniref:sn-glycerol 3-phosphate transport system permease protein n=1 Tax=Devosia enhydra TaxID=665118 RepID=A0A1K2HVZ6_9HYPH|nr:carbohydrate ABC transporter permease [Devosia enhydra]SFZ83023.1 sn-glycerol 3-phosphate transport system permease protein [Devosia enhydra]